MTTTAILSVLFHQMQATLRTSYGLNDAPRKWWNIIDKRLFRVQEESQLALIVAAMSSTLDWLLVIIIFIIIIVIIIIFMMNMIAIIMMIGMIKP